VIPELVLESAPESADPNEDDTPEWVGGENVKIVEDFLHPFTLG
jgi:hypothetical protein